MVKIVDYKIRKNEKGEEFFALIIESGLETVKSKEGNTYFTSRKAGVPSTFNEEKCKELIGEQLPGRIIRVPSEPYEYQIDSGETIILDFKYSYECEPASIEDNIFSEDEELV